MNNVGAMALLMLGVTWITWLEQGRASCSTT